MNDRTEWFTPRQKPVRPGMYECKIKIPDFNFDFIVLIEWNPRRGWEHYIKCWRGLTAYGYIKRKGAL